ncbi:MAG: MarR family winged helix-turn-helix transcriptional regulator [Pseudomonadota bacterium]
MTKSTNGFELNNEVTLALQIDRLMRRFHSDLHPRAQAVDQEKIGPIGGMILYVISENRTNTAQEISQTLGRDKSQVSRVVSLLIQKGLVETSAHEHDARRVTLCLSKQGELQVASFNGAMVETTKSVLGHLSRIEIQRFSNLLSKILSA